MLTSPLWVKFLWPGGSMKKNIAYKNMKIGSIIVKFLVNTVRKTVFISKNYFKRHLMLKLNKIVTLKKLCKSKNYIWNMNKTIYKYEPLLVQTACIYLFLIRLIYGGLITLFIQIFSISRGIFLHSLEKIINLSC